MGLPHDTVCGICGETLTPNSDGSAYSPQGAVRRRRKTDWSKWGYVGAGMASGLAVGLVALLFFVQTSTEEPNSAPSPPVVGSYTPLTQTGPGSDSTKEPPKPPPEREPDVGQDIMNTFHGWLQDFEEAKQIAQSEQKDILILFDGSDWCAWSQRMMYEVFAKSDFSRRASMKYVLVQIDFPRRFAIVKKMVEDKDRNRKLLERFDVEGFPSIVVTDSQGQPYGRFGYQRQRKGVENFLNNLSHCQDFRDELYSCFAQIEHGTEARDRIDSLLKASRMLYKRDFLQHYPGQLSSWMNVAREYDANNGRGVYEYVFCLKWSIELSALDWNDPDELRSLAGALDNWKQRCKFRNPDLAAKLHFLAGTLAKKAGDFQEARRYFTEGLRNEQADRELLALLRREELAVKSELLRSPDILAGSGFMVDPAGYVLTNQHIIAGANDDAIKVRFAGSNKPLTAHVEFRDPESDLALLKVSLRNGLQLPPPRVRSDEVERKEEVAAFGIPTGKEVHRTDGTVILEQGQTTHGNIVLDCNLNPGISGGPLCDKRGNIVGVVTCETYNALKVNGRGQCIPADKVQSFLTEHLPKSDLVDSPTTGQSRDWDDLEQTLRRLVVAIEKPR